MYLAGVDLAWAGRNPTGVAVLDAQGWLVHLSAVRHDAEVLAALRPYVAHDCVVGFDAPLVVTNRTGQRAAETALNRDFRRFEAGAHPVNTGKPEFAEGPRAARLALALGLDMDPVSPAGRRAIEVYPHAATVALFRLPRTLKYKAKPGRSLDHLKSELLLLMDGLEKLAQAPVPLRVAGPDWVEMRRRVVTAQRKSELRRAEDPVDAVVCAYVALYAMRCPSEVTIYGDVATGYIVTPTLPGDLVAGPATRVRSAPDAGRSARARR
jgi:predicted RNase H-like nuclease